MIPDEPPPPGDSIVSVSRPSTPAGAVLECVTLNAYTGGSVVHGIVKLRGCPSDSPFPVMAALLLSGGVLSAQVRLADESDRAAFRAWFTLLADAQFEQPASEVTDCAALIRYAFREALRDHTPAWRQRVGLPFTPQFAEVRSAPSMKSGRWRRYPRRSMASISTSWISMSA